MNGWQKILRSLAIQSSVQNVNPGGGTMDLGKLRELSEHRVCRECGAEFWTEKVKDAPDLTAMQQWSDHLTIHQPTAAQWTVAYNMIREGRERQKKGVDTHVTSV
jgi:hypothetical protein